MNRADAPLLILAGLLSAAVLVVVVVVWRGAHGLNDFYSEAIPAYKALYGGHFSRFTQLGPAYTGSLLLRAPFALLAFAFRGGPEAVYIATALPCVFATSLFGLWLGRNLPFEPQRPLVHVASLVFCALNPVVVVCLAGGHPEELLGATLSICAVVLAQRDEVGLSGAALGLAIVDETWALVVIPVVLAVLPNRRVRALVAAAAVGGLFLVPILVARQTGSASGAATSLGSSVGTIFLAPQLLWWFGAHSWLAVHAREVIVLLPVPLAAVWWVRQRRSGGRSSTREPILLLAFVLLLRAALDPWDNLYYHIPFLFALMVYEADRLPRLTVISTVALMVVAPPDGLLSPDGRAVGYALFAVPMLLWMASRLYVPGSIRARYRLKFPRPVGRIGRVAG